MKPLDPQIAEVCRRIKITDYLRSKGHELLKSGSRMRCKCPLPTHKDFDPSCYIRTMPDGAELFKCFGCGASGNIITLMAAIEGQNKGQIIKRISAQAGIVLNGKMDIKLEPLSDEIDTIFCEEQDITKDIAQYAVEFMRLNPTPDALNKISRVYEMLDKMTRLGDTAGIEKYYFMLVKIIQEYRKKPKKPVDKRTQ